MPFTSTPLLEMTSDELDELFRTSAAGPIPSGMSAGTAIFAPGSHVGRRAAQAVYAVAWKGKVFDAARGALRNRIGPTGVLAIRAEVYMSESWLDGRTSIILDYRRTSLVARAIRDEIRMVGEGEYLGVVYWGRRRILRFALRFSV